ncbi:hypothetical protein DTO166G4_4144 [Paecilomyces variotii]|nr:hypothetical protein DTO166G4_4144 [Paecilomyces variotii]KAJ9231162.1 hypothetical protein DTO166G5_6934 [Paecilomyces variotii]KAJ9307649.1 hypothetical protein DTO217A2_2883 [Paecilomyces variotii]KAJ9369100.1 hypothetical protein DTO282E5_6169 [Paecilomyces variotii]
MAITASPSSGGKVPADGASAMAIRQIIASVVMPTIAIIATGLRFLARRIRRAKPGIEDWLIVGGSVWTIGYGICNILSATLGAVGWSSAVLIEAGQNDHVIAQLELAIAGQVLYALALGIHRLFRSLASVVLILSICWSLQTILIAFLLCRPLSRNWVKQGEGTCGNIHGAYIAIGIVDIFTDTLIFLLPIPMIQTLQVPTRTKLATMAIFALGGLTIGAGITRIVEVSRVEFNPSDVEPGVKFIVWSIVEPSIGVTVACMLVMRPLFVRISESLSSWAPWRTQNSDQGNNYAGSEKVLQGKQRFTSTISHQFVKLYPEFNGTLLNSITSANEGSINISLNRDQERDGVSSHSDHQTVASSSSGKEQFPIHVV